MFLWIVIGVGLLAACGFNASVATADETLDDSETIEDESVPSSLQAEAQAILKALRSGGGPVGDDNVLSGSTWTLRSVGGQASDVVLDNGSSITIAFNDETLSFEGIVACNRYFGTYSIDGSTITFDNIGSTLVGCKHSTTEDTFLDVLADVDGFNLADAIDLVDGTNLQDEKMTLSGSANELIFFRGEPLPAAAFLDKLWVLKALTSNDEETAPVGEPATLRIDSDGSFTGSTGCRTLTGRYLISRTSILLKEMAVDGDCPTSLSDQDGRVIMVLGDKFKVAIHSSALVLSFRNQRLRYGETNKDEVSWLSATSALTDAEILGGVDWIFVGGESPDGPIVDPQSIDSTSSITLTFSDDQYSGNAVCNAYGGEANFDGLPRFTYDELKGDRLSPFTLGAPEGEEESCGDELDEIVTAYRNALPLMSTGGFYSAGQGLYMYGDDANLRFERAQ